MKCPLCGATTEVVDSRLRADGRQWRRRECMNLHRFTSVEVLHGVVSDSPRLREVEFDPFVGAENRSSN